MGMLRLLLLYVLVIGVCVLWWMLLDVVYRKVKPAIERWIWHRLDGDGDPPEKDDE